MQRLLLALFTTLVLGACGGSGPSIEGTWKLSAESAATITADVPVPAKAAAEAAASKATMTFAGGKSSFAMPGMPALEAKYTIKGSSGNEVTLEMETQTPDGPKLEEQVVSIDGDEMTLDLDGQKMTFVRQP